MTSVRRLLRPRYRAAESPANPPPTTMTSQGSCVGSAFVIVDHLLETISVPADSVLAAEATRLEPATVCLREPWPVA
jgi:hypothetical protein